MKIRRFNEDLISNPRALLSLDSRIEDATNEAQMSFFDVVAEHFPEIKTGDISPDATFAFDEACKRAVTAWVDGNS